MADELHEVADAGVLIWPQQPCRELQVRGLRQQSGILHRRVQDECAPVRPGVALDHVQLFGVWRAAAVVYVRLQLTRALDLMGIDVPVRM